MRPHACVVAVLAALSLVGRAAEVSVVRVPDGGFKASAAVDAAGALHLVYFKGEPSGGDAFYVTSRDGGASFSKPLRVNSQPASVLGASSARGPHLALGKEGRVHVLWPGSSKAQPRAPLNPAMPTSSPYNGTPLLYARLDGATFTPQRNLMRRTTALDGDSAIAADSTGRVYVAWHAIKPDGSARGESDRAVWLARSSDGGATFDEETNVLPEATGVCACCALAMSAAPDGRVAILYRVATAQTHRGMRLLQSRDRGETFTASQLDDWEIAMCPMSTAALLPVRDGFLGAWENAGRISLAALPASTSSPLDGGKNCKHPALATNSSGERLLAWTENTSFGRGGDVAWQLFDTAGRPLGDRGRATGLPGHGSVAAVAFPDGRFAVIF